MLNFIGGVIVGLLIAILDSSKVRTTIVRAYDKATAPSGSVIQLKSELEKVFQDE